MGWAQPIDPAIKNQFWGTVNWTFTKLKAGDLHPSTVLRENKLLMSEAKACAYCETGMPLQWEHIIPASKGGPDTIDNMVLACPSCNQSKGNKNVLEWCKSQGVGTPRVVLGKYLKLLLEAHEKNGSLDWPSYPADEPLELSKCSQVFLELRE
jgi:Zn finger protein HypA/HybF involved in hydrogenase expression